MQTLRGRLFLTYVALVTLTLGAVTVGFLLYLWSNPTLERQALWRLDLTLTAVRRRLPATAHPETPRVQEALRRLGEALDVRLLLVDADGQVVLDTRPDAPMLRGALDKTRGVARDAQGAPWLFVSRPWGESRWRLVAAVPRPSRLKPLLTLLRDDLWPPLWQTALVALGLALVLAGVLSRWVARPLGRMAQAAHALAAGEHRPIPVEGPAEVQTLARAFNEMSRQVEASQRSQREFVANVSHELKTPLTSIQGFAQAILDGTASDPDAVRQAAQVIYDEAARMHRLVLDLLDLARLDAADLRREPVALEVLAHNVVQRLQPQAREARVHLRVEQHAAVQVVGDGDRLAQVLTNLVDNALKHTPPGGEVTVQVRTDGPWAVVAVRDTGEGIPTEALPRIFERFYQLDQARRGGVGLGLSIAYEIVRAHGGTLTAHSEPGKGSVFVVKLPRSPDEAPTLVVSRTPT